MLSQMCHPNIVGFRAAQRLPDGHLCLALEHLDAVARAEAALIRRPQRVQPELPEPESGPAPRTPAVVMW